VSIRFGAKGPNSATCTACSASAHAIGDAYEIIKRCDADAMIAGGSEAAICPMSVGGFGQLRALSTRNDEPARASRPFDKDRDGFIIGEGAGVLILEELEHARRRGAKIYAEIVGYGMSSDAYHMTAPSEDGDGARRVMAMAIRKAGIAPSDVDYVNAHGTSTPYNDKLETLAIHNCFGEHASKLAISSTKSMTGHLLGRRGRPRGRHHGACRARSDCTADDQSRRSGSRVRSGLRAAPEPEHAHRLRAVEFLRVRRHQRGPAVQAIRRVAPLARATKTQRDGDVARVCVNDVAI
jgi:hypothetical protein